MEKVDRDTAFLKISKTNTSGSDMSATLSSLTQITIPFTNGSSSVFNIGGITDSGDYYTYLIRDWEQEPIPEDASLLGYALTASVTTAALNIEGVTITTFPEFTSFNGQVPASATTDLKYLFNSTGISFGTYPQKDIVFSTGDFYTSASLGGLKSNYFVELYKTNASKTTRTRLTTSTPIPQGETGGWKGPFTRTATVNSESIAPGDVLYLGCETLQLASGIQDISVKKSLSEFKAVSVDLFLSSIPATGSGLPTVPEPFFTSRFEGSDCDVMYGNVSLSRENPFLQDIDYSTNPSIPINIDLIINGTAKKASIPESYYTSLAQITNRYLGSKNQSSGVNTYKINAGNTVFGGPINVGTYGNVSPVTTKEINIFEYEWGSSTYPMIIDYGQFKLSNILAVSSPSQVKIVQKTSNIVKKLFPDGRFLTTSEPNIMTYRKSTNPLDPIPITGSFNLQGQVPKYFWKILQSRGEFYQTLNGSNIQNSVIQLGNYSSNPVDAVTGNSEPIMPNTSKISSTGWGTPLKPNFMMTSSYNNGFRTPENDNATDGFPSQLLMGSYGFIRKSNPNLFTTGFSIKKNNGGTSATISTTQLNSKGAVQTNLGVFINEENVLNQINSGMTKANRWYISIYRELESPTDTNTLEEALTRDVRLVPYNEGYNTLDEDGNYEYPLAQQGVYEILGTDGVGLYGGAVYDNPTTFFIIRPDIQFSDNVRSGSINLIKLDGPSGSFNIQGGNTPQTFTNCKSSNYNVTASIEVSSDTVFVSASITQQLPPFGYYVEGQTLISGWESGSVINFPPNQFGPVNAFNTGMNFLVTSSMISDNRVTQINLGTTTSTRNNMFSGSEYNGLGGFIWEATGKDQVTGEEYVIIQDKIDKLGPGYFMDKVVPEYITDNIESITKEFGSNKT